MDKHEEFLDECHAEIRSMGANKNFNQLTRTWMSAANKEKYSYHFQWLGRPIIQYPQDIVALQEIIWSTQPDLIIETGIAHGGSLILSASILSLLDLFESESGVPGVIPRKVVGIDIDIRSHNKEAILKHPLSSRIELIEGSSVDSAIISKIQNIAEGYKNVMVILDSNHTHDHVLKELQLYSDFVSKNCYLVVFDTVVEFLDNYSFEDRPWDVGNNPWTAVQSFLSQTQEFEVDTKLENKLQITVAPGGFLKKIK
jgi:cephalosporin hydroxylase